MHLIYMMRLVGVQGWSFSEDRREGRTDYAIFIPISLIPLFVG